MICSRYTALLCALALGAKLASGRSLQQAALTSVPTNASFGNTLMTYLNGNASAVGEWWLTERNAVGHSCWCVGGRESVVSAGLSRSSRQAGQDRSCLTLSHCHTPLDRRKLER